MTKVEFELLIRLDFTGIACLIVRASPLSLSPLPFWSCASILTPFPRFPAVRDHCVCCFLFVLLLPNAPNGVPRLGVSHRGTHRDCLLYEVVPQR
jgi:hypothetical protein